MHLEEMYPGAYDYSDAGILNTRVPISRAAPHQNYDEQLYQIHDSLFSGYEAYDYQNPAVWQARSVITYSTLDPAYGTLSDTPVDILNNISRTGNTTLQV